MGHIHSEIVQAIKEKKLILFVGSGMSVSLGFPTWRGLVNNILDELSSDFPHSQLLKSNLEAKIMDDIKVLNIIKDERKKIYEVIDKTLQLDDTKIPLLERHKKLSQISSKLITTNYDKSLETANTNLKVIIHDNTFRLAKLPTEDNYIFKLHGCISNPDNCILFEEDYQRLYVADSPAIMELKKLIADQTILFIGFSFNDPFIKFQFKYISEIYKSLKGKSFLLTTQNEDLSEFNIQTVKLDNWNQNLDNFLDGLFEIKSSYATVSSTATAELINLETKSNPDKTINIAVLVASPIDKKFEFDQKTIIKSLSKLEATVHFFYLSTEVLNKIEFYDYILVFTKTFQNKIYIEDSYLKSKLTTLEELETEAFQLNPKGVILFVDSDTVLDTNNVNFPIVQVNYQKINLNTLIFKLFRKAVIPSECLCINKDSLVFTQVNAGIPIINHEKTKLPKQIDPKNLINFIGRSNDLENIIRKIVDLDSKVLTIKGSGGIGKTTTIKMASIELAERGYFNDGIHFIDCEFISDYQSFENAIAKCFSIDNSINLKEHISQNEMKLNALIILDNYEPLLYIEEKEPIKDLVAFICDYSTVVITSREWIGFEFEDKYELRLFTTDEATELFIRYYPSKITTEELRILRVDILENLLNNNPLAINIIATNLPKGKQILDLKNELEEDFFNTLKEFENIFEEETDKNIERSKSLYQSINYSYSRLLNNEKLAFELLYLFPNGIHINNFKTFFERKEYRKDSHRITDKEIKLLDNKSLIDISCGFMKLLSITGRFAEHQFNKRSPQQKLYYYERAYEYNAFILSEIDKLDGKGNSLGLDIFNSNVQNILKSLDYTHHLKNNQELKLNYLWSIVVYAKSSGEAKKIATKLAKLKNVFNEVKNANKFLDMVVCYLNYYLGDFENIYNKLKIDLPFNQLGLLDYKYTVDQRIIGLALDIYNLEGKTFQVIQYLLNTDDYYLNNLCNYLFELGEFSFALKWIKLIERPVDFFQLEIELNLGILNMEKLNNYLKSIYKSLYIEIMQVHYLKAKCGIVSKNTIDKLVTTNPYTKGLKMLMLAFIEQNQEKAIQLYSYTNQR